MDGSSGAGAGGLLPLPLGASSWGGGSGASTSGASPASSPFQSPRSRATYGDRFIPSRAVSSRLDFTVLERESAASETPKRPAEREESNGAYNLLLRSELLGGAPPPASSLEHAPPPGNSRLASPARSPSSKMFRYMSGGAEGASTSGAPVASPFAGGLDGDGAFFDPGSLSSPSRLPRKIPRAPFKVLDAPALADDFYLNLVDWSAQNVLAVGLGSCVYLWSACTSKVTRLVDYGEGGAVCSVGWSQRGSYLSIGTDKGDVHVWDAAKCKRVRSMPGHKQRVGCMSWSHHTLATGSRDRSVLLRDVRAADPFVGRLGAHRSEVCGLRWSPDDRELASGGNDNQVMIWSPAAQTSQPLHRFTAHSAAIKALAWSPHQHGLLATGGGTADRCIRFWNTGTGQALSCVDTGSQVCNLSWSCNANEIVSTHGYSQNQVVVWRYAGMAKLATLTGHTMRVLYLAVSPDGQTIVTGAGDETLRFWNVFPGPRAQGGGGGGVGSMMRTLIR